MKSFHTIIDPQTPSPSPRSSFVGRHSRSPSREITPPPSLNTDSSGTYLQDFVGVCVCVCVCVLEAGRWDNSFWKAYRYH